MDAMTITRLEMDVADRIMWWFRNVDDSGRRVQDLTVEDILPALALAGIDCGRARFVFERARFCAACDRSESERRFWFMNWERQKKADLLRYARAAALKVDGFMTKRDLIDALLHHKAPKVGTWPAWWARACRETPAEEAARCAARAAELLREGNVFEAEAYRAQARIALLRAS